VGVGVGGGGAVRAHLHAEQYGQHESKAVDGVCPEGVDQVLGGPPVRSDGLLRHVHSRVYATLAVHGIHVAQQEAVPAPRHGSVCGSHSRQIYVEKLGMYLRVCRSRSTRYAGTPTGSCFCAMGKSSMGWIRQPKSAADTDKGSLATFTEDSRW